MFQLRQKELTFTSHFRMKNKRWVFTIEPCRNDARITNLKLSRISLLFDKRAVLSNRVYYSVMNFAASRGC